MHVSVPPICEGHFYMHYHLKIPRDKSQVIIESEIWEAIHFDMK